MSNWNDLIQRQIVANFSQVKKTTQPLHDLFGIKYFTYHRIDCEGRYSVLLDRPDFAEYYVAEKFYAIDPYLHHPDAYTSGFCLLDMNGTEFYHEQLLKAGVKFNMNFSVCHIQRSENEVEVFGYSGTKDHSALNKLYLNHQNLLQTFASHFKQQHRKILHKLIDEAPHLAELKGQKLETKRMSLQLDNAKREAFLKTLGMGQYAKLASLFSFREKQCLKWLLNGKSAKQTALLMSISRRTVESYFENIKVKLGCWSKNEVFEIAYTLEFLGLLS